MSDRSLSQLVEKIGILNTKLDAIIGLLSSVGEKKAKPTKDKTPKSKKSANAKADKANETVAPIEKKDTAPATKR